MFTLSFNSMGIFATAYELAQTSYLLVCLCSTWVVWDQFDEQLTNKSMHFQTRRAVVNYRRSFLEMHRRGIEQYFKANLYVVIFCNQCLLKKVSILLQLILNADSCFGCVMILTRLFQPTGPIPVRWLSSLATGKDLRFVLIKTRM